MKTLKRVFLASLFLMLTVLLAIWFYPEISEQFSTFYFRVQGGVGGSAYTGIAIGALDVGSALLCVSALFYGVLLFAQRKKTVPAITALEPAEKTRRDKRLTTTAKRRLLLIPIWFLAQFIWNLLSEGSFAQALGAITSLGSLWISAVVITVIVLYAKNYQVVFEGKDAKKPEQALKPNPPEK